jgi:hypothetical protein
MMEHVSYQFVSSVDLASLQKAWQTIFNSKQNRSFIHYYQWFSSYIESHPEESSNAYFLLIENNKNPVAICPIQYVTNKSYGLAIKSWRIFWPGDMGVNDFLISKQTDGIILFDALTTFLNKKTSKLWHTLELQNVAENSDIALILNHTKPSRLIDYYHHDSKYIACKSTYEDTVANISGKFKRNNRRKLNKLKKVGSVSYSLAESEPELEQAYRSFLRIEAANWKGKGNTAIAQNEKQKKFYDYLKNNFGENHQCLVHLLHLDEIPIAGQFILKCGDTLYLLKIGYDDQYSQMGPGALLLDEAIRKFSGDENIKKISFITGAKWNDDWSPLINKVYNHNIYNMNFLGLLSYLKHKVKALGRTIKWKLKGTHARHISSRSSKHSST